MQKWAKVERLIETDKTEKYCSHNCRYFGTRCGLFDVNQAVEMVGNYEMSLRVYACCRATGDIPEI